MSARLIATEIEMVAVGTGCGSINQLCPNAESMSAGPEGFLLTAALTPGIPLPLTDSTGPSHSQTHAPTGGLQLHTGLRGLRYRNRTLRMGDHYNTLVALRNLLSFVWK